MKVLAIDTSGNVAAAALLSGNKVISEYILNHKKTHSQKIMPMVEGILKDSETDIHDIDLFAASVGPGSFTGLRIGIASVNGMAHAVGKPAIGIGTLEALAYNLPECRHVIVPLMDARRNHVYTGAYSWDNGFHSIMEEHDASIEEAVEFCRSFGSTVIFTGDGIYLHMDYIKQKLGDQAYFAPAQAVNQRAASVGALALDRFKKSGADGYIMPMYLKKSQAERELEEKGK